MIPLVYHPRYNITAFGLERRHPFDSRKYQRMHDALIARGLRGPSDFRRPKRATERELLTVHSPGYLQSPRSAETLAGILEIPILKRQPSWFIDWRVLSPMRLAAGGTVLACRLAMERGIAINLGGGFHHAAANWGGGFCVYADTPLALKTLYDEGKIERALVVDLDAHQGNGTAAAIRDWPWAKIVDLYEGDLFPWPKEPEDYPFPAREGMAGGEYLDIVREFFTRRFGRGSARFADLQRGVGRVRGGPAGPVATFGPRHRRARSFGGVRGEGARGSRGDGAFGRVFVRVLDDPRRRHRGDFDPVRPGVLRIFARFSRRGVRLGIMEPVVDLFTSAG